MSDPNYFAKVRAMLLGWQGRSGRKGARGTRGNHHTKRQTSFMVEGLEPRVLLSADLAAAVQTVQVVPEQSAEVLVTNNGPDRVSNAPVMAHASKDSLHDASDVLLGSSRAQGSLRPGESSSVPISLNFSSLQPG